MEMYICMCRVVHIVCVLGMYLCVLLINVSVYLVHPLISVFFLYFVLLQPAWHLSPVRSWWCFHHSKLSTAWLSSSRGAWWRKSNLWALLSCFYEPQFEVWRGRSKVILHCLTIMRYLKNIQIICELLSADDVRVVNSLEFVNRVWWIESKVHFVFTGFCIIVAMK